jgi:hypothetical protein
LIPAPITSDRDSVPRASIAVGGGDAIVLSLLSVLLFLALNPFLALLVLALIAVFRRIPPLVFVVVASLSFALFFFSRDLGIEWYLGSTDDVPDYIETYKETYGLNLAGLWDFFLESPNGHELLWSIPVWALANLFDVSDASFVFLHYLAIFLAVFLALSTFSTRYLVPLVLVYFFLTPISIDAISHIWRQQMAFSVLLAGIGLYTVRGMRIGKWFIYLSPLVHLSSLFFLMGFLTFRLIKANRGFDNKLKFSVALLVILGIVPLLSSAAVAYLDSLGLARIMSYFEGTDANVARVYLLIGLCRAHARRVLSIEERRHQPSAAHSVHVGFHDRHGSARIERYLRSSADVGAAISRHIFLSVLFHELLFAMAPAAAAAHLLYRCKPSL